MSVKYNTHFVNENHQFFNDDGIIQLSENTEYEKNVKILVLSRFKSFDEQPQYVDLFPTNAMRTIRNRAVATTDPAKHSQQLLKKKEHSIHYEKSPKRKLEKVNYDKEYILSGKRTETEAKRANTTKRKEYEKEYVLSGKKTKTEAKRANTTKRK